MPPENDSEWVPIKLQYSTDGEPVWEAGTTAYASFVRRWLRAYIKVHSAPGTEEKDPA